MSAPGHFDHQFTPCPRCTCDPSVRYHGRYRQCSGDRCSECPPTFRTPTPDPAPNTAAGGVADVTTGGK